MLRQTSLGNLGNFLPGREKRDAEDDSHFIMDLLQVTTSEVYLPGEEIVAKGEVGTCMYFIVRGEVEIELEHNAPTNPRLQAGSFFGEIALFYDEPRVCSVLAVSEVEVGVLTKGQCDEVMGRYPNMDMAFRALGKDRMEDNKSKQKPPMPRWLQKVSAALIRKEQQEEYANHGLTMGESVISEFCKNMSKDLDRAIFMLDLQEEAMVRAREMKEIPLSSEGAAVIIQRYYRIRLQRRRLGHMRLLTHDLAESSGFSSYGGRSALSSNRKSMGGMKSMSRMSSRSTYRDGDGGGLQPGASDMDRSMVDDDVDDIDVSVVVDEEIHELTEQVNLNITRRLDEAIIKQNLAQEKAMTEEEREEQDLILLDPVTGRALEAVERTTIAAVFIQHSMKNTPYVRRTPLAHTVYKFGHHLLWRCVIFSLIFAQMCLIFFEPPSSREYTEDRQDTVFTCLTVELICVVVYIFDVGLKLVAKGGIEFSKNEAGYLLCVLLIISDVSIAFATNNTFRYSRPFRSFLLMTRSSKLRDVCASVIRTLPNFVNIAAILGVLVVTYSIICVQLFYGVYTDSGQHFDSFGRASLALFVLLTTENYPTIMIPAYNVSPWYSLIFITFILIGLYLLFNVLVGIILASWGKLRRAKAVEQRLRERKNLFVAFRLLDSAEVGYLNYQQWQDLMKIINPEMRGSQVLALFSKMDVEKDGRLERVEFFRLIDVLLMRIKQTRKSRKTYCVPQRVVVCFENMTPHWMKVLVHSSAFAVVSYLVVVANVVVLCLFGEVAEENFEILYILNFIFLLFFVMEIFMRMAGYGVMRFMRDNRNRFDLVIVLSQIIAQLLIFFVGGETSFSKQTSLRGTSSFLLRVFHALSALRALRLLSGFPRFRLVGHTILQCVPLFSQMAYLALVIFYFFAILGMELFSQRLPEINSATSFDDFVRAILTLFQCLTTSNWHDIMYPAMRATSAYASYYFVAFNVVMVVVIINILIAFIIDNFTVQYDRNVQKWQSRKWNHADDAGFAFEQNEQREVLTAIANIDGGGQVQEEYLTLDKDGSLPLMDMASAVIAHGEQKRMSGADMFASFGPADVQAYGSTGSSHGSENPPASARKIRFADEMAEISEVHNSADDGAAETAPSGAPRAGGGAAIPGDPAGTLAGNGRAAAAGAATSGGAADAPGARPPVDVAPVVAAVPAAAVATPVDAPVPAAAVATPVDAPVPAAAVATPVDVAPVVAAVPAAAVATPVDAPVPAAAVATPVDAPVAPAGPVAVDAASAVPVVSPAVPPGEETSSDM